MQQLPLLIRETIDYYRYMVPHKERMKRLNEEYFLLVIALDVLLCRRMKAGIPNIFKDIIDFRAGKLNLTGLGKMVEVPKYYHYSSGLNHPKGYKNFGE